MTREQRRNGPPNAEEELSSAGPVLLLRAELLRSIPERAGAGGVPRFAGAVGEGEEWRFQGIPEGQERLGLEPVLRVGGVHGLGPSVCGKGKDSLYYLKINFHPVNVSKLHDTPLTKVGTCLQYLLFK